MTDTEAIRAWMNEFAEFVATDEALVAITEAPESFLALLTEMVSIPPPELMSVVMEFLHGQPHGLPARTLLEGWEKFDMHNAPPIGACEVRRPDGKVYAAMVFFFDGTHFVAVPYEEDAQRPKLQEVVSTQNGVSVVGTEHLPKSRACFVATDEFLHAKDWLVRYAWTEELQAGSMPVEDGVH